MGMIDPETLHWTSKPNDLSSNTFSGISLDTRKFALDDVYFTDGKVLTGVQLYASNGFVHTRIFGAKVEMNSNSIDTIMDTNESYELSKNPSEFLVKGEKSGIKSAMESLKIRRSDAIEKTSIRFDTDDEQSNAGQDTLPNFDGSDIVQDILLVLSGIGYIYYTNEGYGGYLRPLLKSVDMKFVV